MRPGATSRPGRPAATIELGLLAPDPQLPADLPSRAARGSTPRSRVRRPAWLVAAVAVAVLLTSTAAAAPVPPLLVRHGTAAAGALFTLTEHVLYVASQDGSRLSAHQLADETALQWEADLGAPQEPWTILELGGSVMLAGLATEPGQSLVGQTTVLDPATGRVQLAYPAFPAAGLAAGRLLFYHHQLPTYLAYDLAGRNGWELPRRDVEAEAFDSGESATRMVTLDASGRLTSYDLDAGSQLATALAPAGLNTPTLWVVGQLVLLQSRWDGSLFDAYDVDTLGHRWTAEVDFWQAFECGTVICLAGPSSLHAIEPATGRPIWSVADGMPDHPFGAHPAGPGWPAGQVVAHGWVLDVATGERVLELGAWQPQGDAMVLRYEYGAGRTWFGRVRPEPPGIQVLGSVDSDPNGCQVTAGHAACQHGDRIHVWRIR